MRWHQHVVIAAILAAVVPVASAQTVASPDKPGIEVGFSPEGSAKAVVLQTIGSARQTIELAAYSFTDPEVVRALLAAKSRGVSVRVLADYKANVSSSVRPSAGTHALNALVNGGIPVRTISVYPIFHDKFLIVDRQTVETGSYNYSAAARDRNSENVIAIRGNPQLASIYLAHWQSRWDKGVDYQPAY